ncbi:hypothetical protein ACWDTQ_31085 [Streptomyces cellulosae]
MNRTAHDLIDTTARYELTIAYPKGDGEVSSTYPPLDGTSA